MTIRHAFAAWFTALGIVIVGGISPFLRDARGTPRLRAGAAAVDVTPTEFPVIVNGYFNERTADRAHDRLMSRAIVLDDGSTRLAIVVVDSLMIPRPLLDVAKGMAHDMTGIPVDRMLISATHTHTAPSVMACLGSGVDRAYERFLPGQIARSIELAASRLQPARIGWAVVRDARHNHCRRWVFRPDRIGTDPFGRRTVRAHMHPGYQSKHHIAPSGPPDTDLSLLAIQTRDGRPMAVLANYAMHYYGATPVSADFCGRFGDALGRLIGAGEGGPPFVGIMSQGTSGDSMWMDYSRPAPRRNLDQYTREVALVAKKAYDSIRYRDDVTLAMAETKLVLQRRVPDAQRLAWARQVMAGLGDRAPHSYPEIYAREQILIHETPRVELKLQAIRIGELGITAIPNEVYGITGLKLKRRSPLQPTFNIELANGAQGYIPPPEQHALGGYTTWPARTAGLEVRAEPKIVATLLGLLEQVSGKPRRPIVAPMTPYARAIATSAPSAWWRLQAMEGDRVDDAAGDHDGELSPGFAWYLPARLGKGKEDEPPDEHAIEFAGGWMEAPVPPFKSDYTVEFWFWNGLPSDARPVTAYLASIGKPGDPQAAGDHLGISGTHAGGRHAGRLIVFNGNEQNRVLAGRTIIPLKTWNHVALVRRGEQVAVYLNGNRTPEISGKLPVTRPSGPLHVVLGARCDRFAPLAGMMTEAAFYARPLPPDEIARHVAAVDPPPRPDPAPVAPHQAVSTIRVRRGMTVELVAAEPLVQDPVAIAWGPDGKLWVAEMADYPNGMDDHGKPGGRVRYLEDTDGDGRYDRSTLFLKDIPFPTGVMPWRGGVLVTAAPQLFYAEDTDGDGRADRRETLFRGFLEGNQQLRVNGLRWGLDGWIYCANGAHHPGYGADRQIEAVKAGTKVSLGSRDFRFRPDTGQIDPQSGPSQFGRNRDDWGNWFGEQNSHPLWHYVLRDHYLRRNPYAAAPDPRHQVITPGNPRVYPAKAPQKRFHSFEQSGRFTSACSGIIYRDVLLFETGMHAFTCEPFHNLVQHNVVEREGVTFSAHRDAADGQVDFFASRDRWCRPVMVRTGPHGALWVVDMYRYMIEHPQWLTPEGRDELRPYYRAGERMGRIYRVYPQGRRPALMPDLTRRATKELVGMLETSHGTLRDLVSQVLIWRNDPGSLEPLARMARGSARPLARLHALCILDQLDQLPTPVLLEALRDQHAGVRRHAIRVAETRAANHPELITAVIESVEDPDPQVRLQLACSLGQWRSEAAAEALAQIALRDGSDPYLAAGAMSSVGKQNVRGVLQAMIRQVQRQGMQQARQPSPVIGRVLAMAVAFGDRQATAQGLRAILDLPRDYLAWQFDTVAGLLNLLAQRRTTLASFLAADSPAQGKRKMADRVAGLIRQARELVGDERASLATRRAAVRLLGREPAQRATDIERLAGLLSPQSPPELQLDTVHHLATLPDDRVGKVLLDGWPAHAPTLRREILSVLTTRRPWLTALLDAIESRRVAPADLDARSREALAVYRDPKIRERIAKLLGRSADADRRRVLQKYRKALQIKGSPERGAVVFKKQCTACHRLGGEGYEVGPHLSALTDRRPQTLLTAILDPNAAVEGKYVTYIVQTDDGRVFSGVIASETGNSMTLVEQGDKRHVILRHRIEAIRSSGKSLMPEGLEKEISLQEMADLISYLRGAEAASQPAAR